SPSEPHERSSRWRFRPGRVFIRRTITGPCPALGFSEPDSRRPSAAGRAGAPEPGKDRKRFAAVRRAEWNTKHENGSDVGELREPIQGIAGNRSEIRSGLARHSA